MKRRDLLRMIGLVAGSSALYNAMATLGFAADSQYSGPIKLSGAPAGTKIVVLGAGWAGLLAALELRDAGYLVQLLDFNNRVGGRAWTLRGGDVYTEMGGETQRCEFDAGLYLNPGPWRIPYHHRGVLAYAKRFNITLEPFMMVNYNAYVHSSKHFGGKPKRFREVQADFHGHVAELLAKAANKQRLDDAVTREDQEKLLAALRSWGALDENYAYAANFESAERRGYEINKGGGLMPPPQPSTPIGLSDLLRSNLWAALNPGQIHQWQSAIFQPVGGMDMTPKAIGREIENLIMLNARVKQIKQDETGVTVSFVDSRTGGDPRQVRADWCVCTIPLSILSQIDINVGAPMAAGISALAYESAVKTGLQMRRRFWEEDEAIYGGISFTDLPIQQISYPSMGFNKPGKGVLLGTFAFGDPALTLTGMSPSKRVKLAVENGTQIHPQYASEFENGISVAWHRVPGAMGCAAAWDSGLMTAHYDNLAQLDGRVILAGDHLSRGLTGWQEGAVLSSLDAVTRLHQRIVNS
nr:L-amino acid oxidase [uncultured bacterium]